METKEKTRRETAVATRGPTDFTEQLIEPFTQLRNEVDRLFEGFPFRLPSLGLGRFAVATPAIEMTETAKNYKISAELPGIDPESVEVSCDDGMLRIAGEKKETREQDERGYHLSERTYGAFERILTLPASADPEKIGAKLKNGVLTVTVAKNGKAKNARTIKVER